MGIPNGAGPNRAGPNAAAQNEAGQNKAGQNEAVAEDLCLCVRDEMLRHEDDKDVFRFAATREVPMRLGIVREERLAEQRQDHLGLAGADLGEMERLLGRDDPLQEIFLFLGGHDLVCAVRVALVVREVLAQRVDELAEGQVLVLVEVEELVL